MGTEGNPPVFSNLAIPPGELLQEELDAIGMTQSELAGRAGRPPQVINEIIRGKKRITNETALELERVLGIPAYLWIRLEADYELTQARLQDQEALRDQEECLKGFPIREMVKRGWLPKAEQVQALLSFLGVASFSAWKQQASLRYRMTPGAKVSEGALAVWLRKGELDAREIRTASYDDGRFRHVLTVIRELTTESPDVFVPRVEELAATAGVAVVFTRELKGSAASGSARWLARDTALIQLSLRYKTNDHLWFSFFHEAGHVLQCNTKHSYIDGIDGVASDEQDADKFACDFLIPPAAWADFLRTQLFTLTSVKKFAAEMGVAPGIVVGRLQHERLVAYHELNDLRVRLRWSDEPDDDSQTGK